MYVHRGRWMEYISTTTNKRRHFAFGGEIGIPLFRDGLVFLGDLRKGHWAEHGLQASADLNGCSWNSHTWWLLVLNILDLSKFSRKWPIWGFLRVGKPPLIKIRTKGTWQARDRQHGWSMMIPSDQIYLVSLRRNTPNLTKSGVCQTVINLYYFWLQQKLQ